MQGKYYKSILIGFIVLLVTVISMVFLNSPGTGDTKYWIEWANNADTYGLVSGFKANNEMYPPFASIILLVALKASSLLGIDTFGAVKLSVFLFLFLTSFLFWLWTRDFTITVILHLSLLLNSVALGLLDIYILPSLILSIWALKEHKLTLFTVFFCIACLTKWQPVILAPFIALYILNIKQVAQWKQLEFKRLFWGVLFPASMILFVTISVYRLDLIMALKAALINNNDYLSGYALNFNWLLTYFLQVLFPERLGSLIDGQVHLIGTPRVVGLIPRLLFFLSYIITVVSFLRCEKTFENLTFYSLVGYLAYFTFNIGVHENHLFLATTLSIILFMVNRKHLALMLILILMSNINLLVFNGLDGGGLMFSRVIGKIDITLLLSFFNVIFFLFLWGANTLLSKNTHPVQEPLAAAPTIVGD